MTERRSLVQGLEETPSIEEIERAFVFQDERKNSTAKREATKTIPEPKPSGPKMTGRVPVTARCRVEIASLLKRVSLQREMDGVEPHYVQDIVEQALVNWLTEKGYM